MKRCPQCEFIYEDDQSLCDMDGVLLVFDSRNLPNLHALAPVSPRGQKVQKRNRTVPAFATLTLAIVLGAVYYVTTQRPVATIPPITIEAIALPALVPASQPAEIKSPEKENDRTAASKPAAVAPARKSTTKTTTQTKPPAEAKKDESKVGSILKKTGRILKKPFKL